MRPAVTVVQAMFMLVCIAPPSLAAGLPEKCRLVPAKGPCKAMIEAAYFDQKQGKCVTYYDDGCGPVKPFETLQECQKTCEQVKPTLKKRDSSGLYYDPVEDDPKYAEVFSKIDAEVEATLGLPSKGGGRGYIHVIWETKQRILKWKYNIDWRTPAELNPHIIFD